MYWRGIASLLATVAMCATWCGGAGAATLTGSLTATHHNYGLASADISYRKIEDGAGFGEGWHLFSRLLLDQLPDSKQHRVPVSHLCIPAIRRGISANCRIGSA